MAARGLDVSGHRSRQVTAADLAAADLILGLAREHARHAVVLLPECWPRTFTLRELLRRGLAVGPRMPGEPLRDWLARVSADRDRRELLGIRTADDVPDPNGGPLTGYQATADMLDALTRDLTAGAGRLAYRCRSRPNPFRIRHGRPGGPQGSWPHRGCGDQEATRPACCTAVTGGSNPPARRDDRQGVLLSRHERRLCRGGRVTCITGPRLLAPRPSSSARTRRARISPSAGRRRAAACEVASGRRAGA